jgi:hypothetical protein
MALKLVKQPGAKQRPGVTSELKSKKIKPAGYKDVSLVEEVDAYIPPQKAGSFDYGSGLTAVTPEVVPTDWKSSQSGTNPNLNNAQKMRNSRDVFMKDIAYGALCDAQGVLQKNNDYALYWNQPSNLKRTISSQQVEYVDTRGVWMRDLKTPIKFTNKCERSIFLQLHVPLAMASIPGSAVWKIQNMAKTLKPGQSFTYVRRTTPASRVSPKKVKTFAVSSNKGLGADLLEFRVNIEDLGAANVDALRPGDAILRIESGSVSNNGTTHGGISYQTLDFVPTSSDPFTFKDNELVWIEECAAGKFDSLAPIALDGDLLPGAMSMAMASGAVQGYKTIPVHPEDDYHNLRGIQFIHVQGESGGSACMAVAMSTSTSTPRPLRLGYEGEPTAVFTDPALSAAVVIHVKDAEWKSMYANNVVFKYHHNAGGWLLWDEANGGFFNCDSLGAFATTLPEYVSIETPLMMTTFTAKRVEDYQNHKGVKQDYDRLIKQLEESGYKPIDAEKEANRIFAELCEKNFPNDQEVRTKKVDWGEIFTAVLLGAVKFMLA